MSGGMVFLSLVLIQDSVLLEIDSLSVYFDSATLEDLILL